jgi:hypothetical protein
VKGKIAPKSIVIGPADPIALWGRQNFSRRYGEQVEMLPGFVPLACDHVYQPAEGGKTFCPMDSSARIIRKATPRFAKIVSHKFARGAATQARGKASALPTAYVGVEGVDRKAAVESVTESPLPSCE